MRCSRRREFVADMDGLYRRLDARIATRNPVCVSRGACCKFGEFGHRLFVTPAELAYFLSQATEPILARTGNDCPYQMDGKCSVRSTRPTGCRIFFCESRSQPWQAPLTEDTLVQLKQVHRDHGLPYAYVDWLDGLLQLSELTSSGRVP